MNCLLQNSKDVIVDINTAKRLNCLENGLGWEIFYIKSVTKVTEL